jgi:type II secretion system (T2SS) protein G
MKSMPRVLLMTALALSIVWVAAFARELGAREAREKIAAALGIEKPDRVRIKTVSPGMGGEAIVEAQLELAFRFATDKQGNWKAVEVSRGDRRWESLELIETAVLKEKTLRTTADMRTLATALESFKRERGFYVEANTNSALSDNLAPRYMNSIIRLDAWSREFEYKGSQSSYRLSSLGPDGKPDTGDEIVFENGQMVKGAIE